MITDTFSSGTIGWVAIATGIAGLLGFVFIALFFTVGQPFGTLNDIFIGVAAILSMVLAWMLYSTFHTQSPLLSQVGLVLALLGGLLAVAGSALTIFGVTGWYLSGLYMAAGNGLIGLWLLAFSYFALKGIPSFHSLAILGIICGVILVLGLVTIPGIFRGIDSKEYTLTPVNAFWWTSALGWLILFPIWSVLLGRGILLK